MKFERGKSIMDALRLGTVGRVEASLREHGWYQSDCPDWAISCWETDVSHGLPKKRIKYAYIISKESVYKNFISHYIDYIKEYEKHTKYPEIWIYFAISDGENEILTIEEFMQESYEL